MKKLNIGIIGTRGIPNNYGGFEQFAERLSAGLVKRGHIVHVYNSHKHPYKEKDWQGVHLIECYDAEFKMGTVGQFFYDRNCLRDARHRNFDVLLHLGYTSDAVWWRGWPTQSINIVNMDGLEWKRGKYNAITRRFLRWSEKLAAKHADHLISDSPVIKDYLLSVYKKSSNYIPYGADIFSTPDPSMITSYGLTPHQYFLVVARMEPENNIEMIINGFLASDKRCPLLIVGNITNRFGRWLTKKYTHPLIKFSTPIYDQAPLNNIRYHSLIYFHGHSVGGTNPSLLEAMACGCNIVAHDNVFNKAVLEIGGEFFTTKEEITSFLNSPVNASIINAKKERNLRRLREVYGYKKIIDDYEQLMLKAFEERAGKMIS